MSFEKSVATITTFEYDPEDFCNQIRGLIIDGDSRWVGLWKNAIEEMFVNKRYSTEAINRLLRLMEMAFTKYTAISTFSTNGSGYGNTAFPTAADKTFSVMPQKTYIFWILMFIVLFIAVVNLLLLVIMMHVLRLGDFMESIEVVGAAGDGHNDVNIANWAGIKFLSDVAKDQMSMDQKTVAIAADSLPISITGNNAPLVMSNGALHKCPRQLRRKTTTTCLGSGPSVAMYSDWLAFNDIHPIVEIGDTFFASNQNLNMPPPHGYQGCGAPEC